MSSPARLPDEETRQRAEALVDALDMVVEELEALQDDERWRVWNAGGAPFGRPEFRGPGQRTAEQFTEAAMLLRNQLDSVCDSFEHRIVVEARREARKQEGIERVRQIAREREADDA